MADKIVRIFITPEAMAQNEAATVTAMLDSGLWDIAHLRHPSASLREMRHLIESIPQRLHGRLRVHGHFLLASEFNLGGLHLNGRCPVAPAFYSGPVSRSCHSIEEAAASTDCDYVTLSPIFDSISKPGHKSAFSADDLKSIKNITAPRIIALGGITPERVGEVIALGFGGYAVKGAANSFIKDSIITQ